MNNYLDKVFDTPNKKAFIAFLTAGDPDADSTVKFILEMEKVLLIFLSGAIIFFPTMP